MPTTFCWSCYTQNDRPTGPCRECGREIAAPEGTSFETKLIWALRHPLRERRMVAARVLGELHVAGAREPLRELATQVDDPYLAAAAVEALVALDGADVHADLLARLAHSGPAPARRVAQELSSRR